MKLINRHVGREKREQVLQTENLWACITGQIVFVLESFGGKAVSEHLLLILHMALQLLYQNFVPLTILPAYTGQKCPLSKIRLKKCTIPNKLM